MTPTGSGKTILLVQDSRALRNFVVAMLQKAGYRVISAVNGQDALEKSREFSGAIDMLISAARMPNMTGMELAAKIQIDRPAIRVLLTPGMGSGLLLLNARPQVQGL